MYEKYVVRAWEEEGFKVPSPYERVIKHIFAPDKRGINELTFSFAIIPPGSKTHNHKHDRGEVIYVVTGRGEVSIDGETYEIEPDVVLWAPKNVMHQVKNPGEESIKLATVFVPAYESRSLKESILQAAKEKSSNSSDAP